ncbi:hypothetical protein [Streptomyces axinellae]|uniref:Uncharacterized protein n=1 Tax=Streptomyces axinellae TaxID=552788 RepID=A0ABP6C3W6_9ACTN
MTTNPFARYAAFPEMPSLIANYVAARSAEESAVDGPSPWGIGALPAELLEPMPVRLDSVCRWLNRTYAWQPHQVIPPCWSEHQHLPCEIAALAFARIDAYEDAGSSVVRHEQYDRFLTRMNNALGKAGDECRNGRHDDQPVTIQLAAWPWATSPDNEPQGSGPEEEKAA